MFGVMGGGMISGTSIVELTPVITSFVDSIQDYGYCTGAEVTTSAITRLAWTVVNPPTSYKLYQDGVLLATVTASPYDIPHGRQIIAGRDSITYAWTFRLDAILLSGAVGASSSIVVERLLGGCSGGPGPS